MPHYKELIQSGSFFWFCALAGSGMFLIQFAMNVFGSSDGDGFDSCDDVSGDFCDTDSAPSDSKRFKWLSMQALTGFLMMFGWTAITCQNEFGLQSSATIAVSLFSGVFTAVVIRSIFNAAKKLKSSGSICKIEEAVGKEAYIYQAIPQGGVGKVSVSLQNFTHEIDAVSIDSEEIASFVRVKIIEKKDGRTVVVKTL